MANSIVNHNELSLPSIQSRPTALNWKFKLFIGLLIGSQLVIVIYLYGGDGNKEMGKLEEFKAEAPRQIWRGHHSSKLTGERGQRPIWRGPHLKNMSSNFRGGRGPRPRRRELTYPKDHTIWRNPDSEKVTNLRGGRGEVSQKEIVILHWNKFGRTTWPTTVFLSDNCSILKTGTTQRTPVSRIFDTPCTVTFDRSKLNVSQAVVIYSSDPPYSYRYPGDLPKGNRPKNQMWVWLNGESPFGTIDDLKSSQNVFNWAMTYRRDSDVYYPYSYIVQRNNSSSTASNNRPSNHNRKSLKMKSGLAAWIVSHCRTKSRREHFVKELQKYIPVDIFGRCAKKKCPLVIRNHNYAPCYQHIKSKYKFYLSFENSLCLDYITEKFYLALQNDMVPVVYGGGIDDQMDYLAVAPQNSFIDARKFKSPKDLANYLIYLDKNDEEYLKYFEWKDKYEVIYKNYGQYGLGWCNLCQRLFEQMGNGKEDLGKKWYSDLDTWWKFKTELNSSAQLSVLASQSKSAVISKLGQSFQFGKENLKPICVRPKENFLPYRKYHAVT